MRIVGVLLLALIGATGCGAGSGSASVTFREQAKIVASDGQDEGAFGMSTALDGALMIAGGSFGGAADWGSASQAQTPPPPPPPPAVKIPPLTIRGAEHMVDVGGRRLNCFVYGSDGPTVVLVSGFQAPQAYWNPIVPGLAEVATVVTYDRAGYGKSERGGLPVHGLQTAADLHALLGELDVPKPYLLVGHSYGGRIVRLFASAYPSDVAGLVLEEASHEDLPDAQLAALSGRDRETLASMIAPFRATPADPRTETDYMATTVEQLRRSGPLPRVPLIVITSASRGSGLPPVFGPESQARLAEVAMAMQRKLVELLPDAEHILVEGAGHNAHVDKPEAVLAPIRAMVARLRRQPE